MKVVVCFYFRHDSIPLGKNIAAAFASLGHDVFCFDSSARESWKTVKRLAKSFAKLAGAKRRLSDYFEHQQMDRLARDFEAFCRSVTPDFILDIRGEGIDPEAVARVESEFGATTAVWWVKNPRWQDQFNDVLGYYHRAFSIDESACNDMVSYLPSWAVNHTEFFPLPFESKKKHLLFVGAWSSRRQQYLEAVSDVPLEIIGPNWLTRLPRKSPLRSKVSANWVSQTIMAEHYRAAWAVIDIRQIDQVWEQGVNMRFADVPASGTVLLTEPSREVARWHLDESCAVLFSSPSDLREQATSFLSDKERCRTMCQKARLVAEEMPSFIDRAKYILDSTKRSDRST